MERNVIYYTPHRVNVWNNEKSLVTTKGYAKTNRWIAILFVGNAHWK